MGIDEVITKISGISGRDITTDHQGEDLPFPYRCTLGPPEPWDRIHLERQFRHSLPPELVDLWHGASRLHLYEDYQYRKWGLILWSPAQILENHRKAAHSRESELRPADLLIGEFLGDDDLLGIRCERSLTDFGTVFVSPARLPRSEWYFLSLSLSEFLNLYLETTGDKWWEVNIGL